MSSNGRTARGNPAPPAQSTTNGTRGGGPSRRPNHNPSTSSASHSPSKDVKRKKSGDNQVRQQMLDTALARALFATAVPFSKFDHPLWSQFFYLLNYVPPTPDDLRNSLLEREYKQCQTKNETSIGEADRLGIMAGYFSNVRLDSAVNIIVTTPQPVLWKQKIYLGNRGKDLIGDELLSAINKLGPQKFWLLVTNYEDGYAADKVVEKYPHITQVKCASQCWDLLVGDLIQSVPEMAVRFQEAKEIVKHFKFCSERLAVFKENQAEIYLKSEITTLKRSGVISWAQSVTMLLSVIKNEDALKNSAKTAPDIDKSIKDSVLDERFWKDIKCFSEILSRIHAAITYIAGEQAGLSDVYHIHMLINEWVKSNLTKLGLGEKAEKVDTVLTESLGNLIHPIHLAAYLLDKRYEGMALDGKGVEHAKRCIQNLRNHPGLVEIQEEEKKGRIAEIIIAMPPSAAECSRRRWEHAFIHSKARNRLTNDRAAMLVQIRGTLRADLQAKKRSARTPMTVQQLEEYFAKYPENTDADAETDSDDGEQQAVLPRLVRQAKICEYFQSRAPSTSRASSD